MPKHQFTRKHGLMYHVPPALAKASKGDAAIPKELQDKARAVLAGLRTHYADAACTLQFTDALELLVAAMLSAQCTDKKVNAVTRELFATYRRAEHYAKAPQEQLEQDIHAIGLFRNKARNIRAATQILVDRFAGRVPDTLEELIKLPGVGRKTANVVLGSGFGKNEGIAVDTHVQRVVGRLGISERESNQGGWIEHELKQLFPRPEWTFVSHALIAHGRQVCVARRPKCSGCPFRQLCPSALADA